MPIRLGFIASHRGSNMQAIVDACNEGRLDAIPAVVISNNSGSQALQRARADSIPAYHVSAQTHPGPGGEDQAILEILQRHEVDLVILAGYMKKIGAKTMQRYRNRILNIHPALLPKYGGQGMYGSRVHEAVVAAGDPVTGASVHLADEEYDHGPVVAQLRVAVQPGDTPETLAERVLEVEHELYVDTVARIASGEIDLDALEPTQR